MHAHAPGVGVAGKAGPVFPVYTAEQMPPTDTELG
jgi:hypothetical protein